MKSRKCPICDNKSYTLKLTKNTYKIIECNSCNHIYVQNPNEDTSSPFNGNAKIDAYKIRHHQMYRLIKNLYKDKTEIINIAEIGSGIGNFAYLVSEDEKINYIGYEPSLGRYEFTQRYNLNTKNELFQISEIFYDAIIIDNVLEHVENPSYFFKIASKSLKSEGVFIVIVPNKNDIRRFMSKWRERHYWQPNCHINYFSFNNLKYLAEKNNMKLYDFGFDTLDSKNSIFLRFNTFLDSIGIHIGGLYTYAIKQ